MEILGYKIEKKIKEENKSLEISKENIKSNKKGFFEIQYLHLKKSISLIFKCYYDKFNLTIDKGNIKRINTLKLNDLTANALEEDDNIYVETLYWSFLKNNIQNIAITGYYGTGKSTIINTFISKHPSIKNLKISLAKFKEEETFTNDLEIENSILQQLFYSTRQKILSESRNKRIKYAKFLVPKVILFLIWLNSLLFIFYPVFLKKITLFKIEANLDEIFKTVFIIGFCIIIYFFFKSILNLKITKISLKDAEFKPQENIETSALNKNIDEILYYFEKTKTKMVFIEDLDRFNKPEIFVKLREINSLINNCNDIKHSVKFIYAIKDELFTESEKTKFFDFIIPVIPFINSKSSKIFLTEELLKFDIDKELLKIISPTISDMRTLKNICNEFKIYYKIKSAETSIENGISKSNSKLLALIVYKNIYPDDFSKIQLDKGLLNAIFNKQELIKKLVNSILEKISENSKKLKNSENEIDLNIVELKKLYLNEIIIRFPEDAKQYYQAGIKNKIELLDEEYSDNIIKNPNNPILYCTQSNNIYFNDKNFTSELKDEKRNNITFRYVEDKIIGKSFNSRKENILNKNENNKNKILKENVKFTEELTHIQSTSLKDLYEIHPEEIKEHILKQIKNKLTDEKLNSIKNELKLEKMDLKEDPSISEEVLKVSNKINKEQKELNVNEEIEQYNLLLNLLETGYIDENYHHYISKFHTGSLTLNENDYLKYILDNNFPKFNVEIKNIDNFIEEIPDFKFKNEVILNYEILCYLLLKYDDSYNSNKLTLFISNLKNYSDLANNFYNGFLFHLKEKQNKAHLIGLFIERFCYSWDEFIFSILNNIHIDSEDKKTFFNIIISAYPDLLIGQNHSNYLTNYFNDYNNLIDDVKDNSSKSNRELINSLIELNVKLKSIKYTKESANFFKEIYMNNLYEINLNNIEEIILYSETNTSLERFKESFYTLIKESNLNELVSYVSQKESLEIFVNNVLNKIESNKKESESIVKEILLSQIRDEVKEELLKNQSIIFKNIEDFEDINIQDLLFKLNKIVPNWENIFHYCNHINELNQVIDGSLESFLNIEDNYKTLSKLKIDDKSKKILEDDNRLENLLIDITNSNISKESFENIINRDRLNISNLNDYRIKSERIAFLVKNKIIETNSENFNYLKKIDSPLRIQLIENNKDIFINDLAEFNLDNKDFILLMNSKTFSEDKIAIIYEYDYNNLFDFKNPIECKKIFDFFLNYSYIDYSKRLLELLLISIPETENKIILFNKHFETLSDLEITKFINVIGDPINKILTLEEFDIENNTINNKFCENLKNRGLINILKRKNKIFIKY